MQTYDFKCIIFTKFLENKKKMQEIYFCVCYSCQLEKLLYKQCYIHIYIFNNRRKATLIYMYVILVWCERSHKDNYVNKRAQYVWHRICVQVEYRNI